MAEISARLKSVTPGAASQEFSLRRNQLGQLGFHVQHDGLITEVENFGYAWQTGLRQGSRLVYFIIYSINIVVDLLIINTIIMKSREQQNFFKQENLNLFGLAYLYCVSSCMSNKSQCLKYIYLNERISFKSLQIVLQFNASRTQHYCKQFITILFLTKTFQKYT